jgi:PBP1b-binding outer membrane lipoprotein LpoB
MKTVILIAVVALALAGCNKKEVPVAEPVQKAVSSAKVAPTVITAPVVIKPAAPVKK